MSSLTNIYNENYQKFREKQKSIGLSNNATVFASYYATVTNSWKWKLPNKDIPFFYPEKFLCYTGMMASFMDGDTWKMYPAFPSGFLEEFGEFSKYVTISVNGETKNIPVDECVLCYNNTLAIPSIWLINDLCNNATRALKAVNKTLRRAAFSKIITAKNPQDREILKGVLEWGEIDDERLALLIVSDSVKDKNVEISELFDNRADDVLALWDVYVRYRNMFYTTFGINTVEIAKKERLTEAEGSGNDEIVRYGLFTDMTACRTDFVQRNIEKFNLDVDEISVSINRDSSTVYETLLSNDEKIENEIIEISRGDNIQKIGGEDFAV